MIACRSLQLCLFYFDMSRYVRKRTFEHARSKKNGHSDQSLRCPYEEIVHSWLLICAQWRYWSYCASTQADLNLHRTHIVEGTLLFWHTTTFTSITKTCLYNIDHLKPHFYIVRLGFTGVYIIFLISAQNIDCGYSLELPSRGGSNEYPQSMFWAEIWKISEFFYLKIFSF